MWLWVFRVHDGIGCTRMLLTSRRVESRGDAPLHGPSTWRQGSTFTLSLVMQPHTNIYNTSTIMPPELIPDDGDYASEEDSDFAPDGALAAEAEDSSDEEPDDAEQDTTTKPTRPKKRKRGDDEEAEDAGIENSGDEAIIGDGLKRDKKRRKEKKGLQEEDEGGEGGLVKTRSMRAQEYVC